MIEFKTFFKIGTFMYIQRDFGVTQIKKKKKDRKIKYTRYKRMN